MSDFQLFNPYRRSDICPIPTTMLNLTCLTPGAKLCYGVLRMFSGKRGYCFPNQEQLAEAMGVSTRQVTRYIKELVDNGFIHVVNPQGEELRKGWNNRYYFIFHQIFQDEEIQVVTVDQEALHKTDMSSVHKTSMSLLYRGSLVNNSLQNYTNGEQVPMRDRMRASPDPHEHMKNDNPKQTSIVPKKVNVPDHIKEIISLYYDDFFIKQLPSEDSKQYQKDVITVRKALSGTLFKGHTGFDGNDRPFTIDEIKMAIERHALSLDPEYYPANKNFLNVYLEKFFFSPYSKVYQSFFLERLSNEPKKVPGLATVGNRGKTVIVARLMELMGVTTLPPPEMDKLVSASYRIFEFFKDPDKDRHWNRAIFDMSLPTMAEAVYEAVKEDINGSIPITAGFFLSNKTFSERVPKYLSKNAFILNYKFQSHT